MLLALHNLYPSLRPYTQPFFELSYHDPASNTYVQGWNDVYFVASATLALTAIRAIVIELVIQPMGRSLGLKRKAALRLAEQGWQVLYYGFIWSIGLVCAWLEYVPLEKYVVWRADILLISSFSSISGRIPIIGSISAPFGMSGRRVRSVVS
jgi:acyl-CoA-dependent ceramide synthase